MKHKFLLLIFLFACLNSFSQVGLLSANNKTATTSTASDTTNFRLPAIVKSISPISEIPKADTFHIEIKQAPTAEIIYISNSIDRRIKAKKQTQANNDSIASLRQKLAAAEAKQKDVTSLLSSLLNSNYYKTHTAFKTWLDSSKSDIDNFQKALSESNFLTRHYPIDTSNQITDVEKFTKEMAKVYAQLELLNYENTRNRYSFFNAIRKLELIKVKDTITDWVLENKRIDTAWAELARDTAALSKKITGDTSRYSKIEESLKTVMKNFVKAKKKDDGDKSKTNDFGAFPLVSSVLGKRETIPQLQLYGSYTKKDIGKTFEGNISLSVAPTSSPDTGNLYSIFIPAASKFLINSNFEWTFLPAGSKTGDSSVNLLGVRIGVAFASKNLVFDTTKLDRTISSFMMYTKAGIEFGIIPKRLSVYANINSITVLDKNDEFVAGTGVDSKFFGFVDCGAKFYLDPTPHAKVDDKLFIFANINCIINTGDVKRVIKTNDAVIPTIQLGIVKSLGKF